MTLPIPAAALEQHVIALGKTGSGKSSKMRLLIEHLLRHKKPVTIIDPKGDWWGLKSSADGKSEGFPLVIFGGKHADVPLTPGSGKAVAELVSTGNRPCLIDLRGWRPTDRTRWFIDFAETTFEKISGKRYLMIAEVHNFAPKGRVLSPEAGEMLHWANRLASEGRGLGLTLLADSQRPQKVHNDLLTSCETLIACRVIHKADRTAIEEWIDGCADPALGKQVIRELATMKRPEAWVWSPEIDFGPQRIEWPLFETFDSFKPQEAGATGKLKGWAEVNLEEVKAKLVSVIKEAEANDPVQLRKQIAELQRQVKSKAPAAVDPDALNNAAKRGFDDGFATCAREFTLTYAAAFGPVREATELLKKAIATPPPHPKQASFGTRVTIHPQNGVAPATRRALESVARNAVVERKRPAAVGNGETSADIGTGGKRRIMIALAQNPEGCTQRKLAILTDIAPKGGTWRTYMAELRGLGYIEGGRDLLKITDAGVEALGSYEPLPTGDALIEYWRQRLGDSGKRKIFDAVLDVHPNSISTDDVSEITGIAKAGGTWRTYLAELRGLEIIEGRDQLKASEVLFT